MSEGFFDIDEFTLDVEDVESNVPANDGEVFDTGLQQDIMSTGTPQDIFSTK